MRLLKSVLLAVLLVSCSAVPPDDVTESDASVPSGGITITGVVTGEGVECPAVRGDDQKLYTIAGGDRNQLRPGMRVRITGTVAEISFCQQGTTINASKVEMLLETK